MFENTHYRRAGGGGCSGAFIATFRNVVGYYQRLKNCQKSNDPYFRIGEDSLEVLDIDTIGEVLDKKRLGVVVIAEVSSAAAAGSASTATAPSIIVGFGVSRFCLLHSGLAGI